MVYPSCVAVGYQLAVQNGGRTHACATYLWKLPLLGSDALYNVKYCRETDIGLFSLSILLLVACHRR